MKEEQENKAEKIYIHIDIHFYINIFTLPKGIRWVKEKVKEKKMNKDFFNEFFHSKQFKNEDFLLEIFLAIVSNVLHIIVFVFFLHCMSFYFSIISTISYSWYMHPVMFMYPLYISIKTALFSVFLTCYFFFTWCVCFIDLR